MRASCYRSCLELAANRAYKDTIFRWIFSDKENLLSLYNSIAGKNYKDPELKVTMLNINAGHNKELLENCHILGEYAQYVDRVRKYVTQMDLNHAVERAITECIQEGILTEFLQRNRAEVFKVSIFEYDKEKEEKKLRKAEYEHGLEDGKTEGISIERENMKKKYGVE